MKRRGLKKRIVSIILAVLMAVTGLVPAFDAFAADGVEGYYDIELFYKDTDTIVPSTMLNDKGEEVGYIEYMVEGDELPLKYKLIDTVMPDNGYVKWYSETPTLVDVTQDGVVKAFDSSKGAVIHMWIDNEVRTIPLVGDLIAKAIEKVLFNDYVNVDTMDNDAIIALVEEAFGSDSLLGKYVESYKGELIDSLRYYLDNINSNVHCQLFDADGTLLDDDYVQICVTRNNEWYANFLPNGTHITNKEQINTTVAVGSSVQLYAVTTPVRLQYGCVYSVKSSSIFEQGKVIATVDDSGLVTFKNKGTVTIMVSPDTEQVIENILKLVNYFYEINGELIDSHQLADILIKYVGLDINRNVLAAILDTIFAVVDIAGDAADPVQLTATAVKIIANLVLQFAYNDTITFTVVDATPLTNFNISGATSVKEGTEIKLSITDIEPSTGDTSDITWRSSDPNIASVDPKTGVIMGRDAGGSLGALSSQTVTIYATSAANNIEKPYTITVVGRTGQYISDVEIIGENYLEMGMQTDYSFAVYPKRVAEGNLLSFKWGMVTGEDEDGNPVYTWADSENPATDGRGSIDARGHYTVISGGVSEIAIMAQTGYDLSNGKYFEISSFIKTMTVTNGIPVESIQLSYSDVKGIFASFNGAKTVEINGEDCTYISVGASTQYSGLGAVINAQVYPANASNQNLIWVIDNGDFSKSISDDTHSATITMDSWVENADAVNVCAVSADGLVRSNIVTICVSKNNVTENIIVEDSIELTKGKTADAHHDISFKKGSDGTYSACYKCNWYSSDPNIFTVKSKTNSNRDAVITGVDVGTATLTCVSADGGFIDTCQITVYPDKEYLQNIVTLCDKTVIKRTSQNASLYKKYMNKLDLAYTILYDKPMASQSVCDTYADELLSIFFKLGGFIGLTGVDIRDKGEKVLKSDYVTVEVGTVSNYTNYSYDFDYVIKPKDAMYKSITWTSSNPNVKVDANGVCKPKSNDPCCAVITCTVTDYMGGEVSDSVCIAFSRNPATGVKLNTDSIVGGKIGETQTLTATVSPTGVSSASNKDIIWKTSDPNIATVDNNGVVTFVAGGDCVVTATTIDGGFTAQCAVNVVTNYTALQLLVQQYNDLSLNSVNYYPDSWEVYANAMAKAQGILDRASSSQSEVDAMYVELESAYKSLQKYNYIQKIELYLDGEATSEFYQYDLSIFHGEIRYTDAVLDLNVRLYPNNGSYQSVEWSSSTSDISVTSDGKCSPTIKDSCYGLITCKVTDHFGNEFTDTVWVSFARYPVTALKLSADSISGAIGTTYQLACTVEPTGTSLAHIGAASIQDYYWESDDETVATVDQTGLVTFTGAGATKIRAVSYDGGITGECIVSGEGDRSRLLNALDDYKDVDYRDYAYDYGTAYLQAYNEAIRALNDVSYTQQRIDDAADNLVIAYNNMIEHPYIKAESIVVNYTTTRKKTLETKPTNISSGTIGSNDALSVDLSNSNYADYNNNNWVTLSMAASPSNAMYKLVRWDVLAAQNAETSVSDNDLKITPTKKDEGACLIINAVIVDHYDRETTRMIIVTLSDNICNGFDITSNDMTLYATDAPQQLYYTISGSPEFTYINWTSSNTDAVTVDANGLITPVEKGTAKITAKTFDGGYSDTITINVVTDFRTLASKYNEYYDVIREYSGGYAYTAESLDALAAVVSEAQEMITDGRATQAEVNEMITRLDDAYDGLKIYVPVRSVKISANENDNVTVVKDGYIHYIGSTINNKQLTLKPVFNSEDALYSEIVWTSSNSNITVDEGGVVTNTSALAGVTLITCTVTNVYNQTFEATAYVSFARYYVTGISFEDEYVYGAPSQTVTLNPKFTNNDNKNIISSTVTECTYVSSDPSIATVDDNGVVTFVSQGTATITATSKDGGYTAQIDAFTTWDTTALGEAIAQASVINYMDYAYTCGMEFKQAYEDAQAVYANIYATQDVIDEACRVLTEAMSNLEGNEFIAPKISFSQNGNALSDGGLVQVSAETQSATISIAVNEDAMIKTTSITTSDENNVIASVNGNSVTVTKTAETGSVKINVNVIDDYDREYVTSYTFSVIDSIIPVTSIVITADGQEITDGKLTISAGGTYTNYKGTTLGFIATPSNANAITDVQYTSSNSNVTITNGVIGLSSKGKLNTSNTSVITCTVTNADGSTVSQSFTFSITRA